MIIAGKFYYVANGKPVPGLFKLTTVYNVDALTVANVLLQMYQAEIAYLSKVVVTEFYSYQDEGVFNFLNPNFKNYSNG